MEKQKFYLTTPLYFPNNKLHIGHSYTTVVADSLARYKKMRGFDVKFLTGLDEHGQKIERVALGLGLEPKVHVDRIAAWTKDLWELMNIEYDIFIRTTDDYHEEAVKKIFKKIYDKGDIYKGFYEGRYCSPCETFFTERQLVDGKCPDCGREVELVKEEAYFFKLSNYQDRLMKHLDENPEFIMPLSRRNEMVNNFIKPGLEDLCVSRTSFKWGIPVDFDPGHVVYVWIDALSNYITALGYLSEDDSEFKKYWPANVHIMAKEIVRFHSIIWPCMLMALDVELPGQIFGHGWLIFGGGKMSKSKGNVIDPKILVEKYGVDAIRYFLMREVVFGQDGNFSNEALIGRINSDLANDLGNLLSRSVAMCDKYFSGVLPDERVFEEPDGELRDLAKATVAQYAELMDGFNISLAISAVMKLVSRTNKYIDETRPWVLAKDPEQPARLASVLANLFEVLRLTGILLSPVMPSSCVEIFRQLGLDGTRTTWDAAAFEPDTAAYAVCKGEVLFPRIAALPN